MPVPPVSSPTTTKSIHPRVDQMKRDSHALYWDDLQQSKFLSLYTTFMLAIRTCIYPQTLLKTLQQTAETTGATARPKSIFATARAVVARNGVAGVYRGFPFNLLGLPVDPLYIAAMEISRQHIQRYLNANASQPAQSPLADFAVSLTCGSLAAVVQQSVIVPIDVVTQNIMIRSQSTDRSKSAPMTIIRDIIQNDGIRGLYKGYGMTLAAVVPFSALMWAFYWTSQQTFTSMLNASSYAHDGTMYALIAPTSAAIASSLASVMTQPMDTLKTRLQVQSKRTPITETLAVLMKAHGAAGLMRGTFARVATVTPSAIASMTAYETLKTLSVKPDLNLRP